MEESHRTELVMMSFRHLLVKNERIVKQWERWPFRAAVGDAFLPYFSKEGLCWVAIKTSCLSCHPKGSPWTYRILTLIFNCTHRLSCLDSKQKSDKFLVNATICAEFWREEGINMTLEEITAAVHLFSPFLVWSHLKLVLLFFSSLVAWCLWQLYGCPSYLLLSQPYQSEDGGKMKAVPSAHTLVQKCW